MKKFLSISIVSAILISSIFVSCKKTAIDDSFVLVKGAKFTMGNDEDTLGYRHDAHETEVSDFYCSPTLVTQAEYLEVMGVNDSFYQGDSRGKKAAEGEEQEKRPAEKMSWYEAIIYCNKLSVLKGLKPVYSKEVDGKDSTDVSLWGEVPVKGEDSFDDVKSWNAIKYNKKANGYRLLTEAEWEFAARGGTVDPNAQTNTGPGFMVDAEDAGDYAWGAKNSKAITHQVATKKPNALGLYDMSGNVWEWCWDWFSESYYKAEEATAKNPRGPEKADYRVVRGGSWEENKFEYTVYQRGSSSPHLPSRRVGFRIARNYK